MEVGTGGVSEIASPTLAITTDSFGAKAPHVCLCEAAAEAISGIRAPHARRSRSVRMPARRLTLKRWTELALDGWWSLNRERPAWRWRARRLRWLTTSVCGIVRAAYYVAALCPRLLHSCSQRQAWWLPHEVHRARKAVLPVPRNREGYPTARVTPYRIRPRRGIGALLRGR